MYFSKITLKHDLKKAKLFEILCPDEYKIHQHLWNLFSISKEQPRNFLYRMDENNKWPQFYTVSGNEPKDEMQLWDIISRTYSPILSMGQRLSFSLRVNPVVSRKGEKRRNSAKGHHKVIRNDVVKDAKEKIGWKTIDEKKRPFLLELIKKAGHAWLNKRVENSKEPVGFNFNPKEVIVEGYRQVKFYTRKSKESIQFNTLDFNGILIVTDPKAFQEVLFSGIGPAKAFGCGLLLVRKIYKNCQHSDSSD